MVLKEQFVDLIEAIEEKSIELGISEDKLEKELERIEALAKKTGISKKEWIERNKQEIIEANRIMRYERNVTRRRV